MYNTKTTLVRHLPDDLYVGQVSSLYADRKSVVMGLVNSGICGIVTLLDTGAPLVAAPVVGMLVIGAVRLHNFGRFAAVRGQLAMPEARDWQRSYTIGVSCYLACMSVWAFCVLAVSATPFPVAIALAATVSTAFGIPIRNFAFARGAMYQIIAVATPLFACCAWLGGRYWLLGVTVFLPTFLFMKTSAARLRDLLLDELVYRQKSEETAGQLDTAVNSMTLGLCMFSIDGDVMLANGRFRSMMGLSSDSRIRGRSIETLLRAIRYRGIFDGVEMRRLRAYVTQVGDRPFEPLQIVTVDQRYFEISVSLSASGNSVIVMQDITDRRMAECAVDRMAWFDMLTDLPNRRSFDVALQDKLASARDEFHDFSVLFIDIDDFKTVNDTLGHKRGDSFLIEIANRVRIACGADHLAARWGGDEFVVLTNSVDGLEELAASLISSLSQPCTLDGYEVSAGASIGIATSRQGVLDADTILQHADMALYAAKAIGRNQWKLYTDELSAAAQDRQQLERAILSALEQRRFELYFQPIINLKTGAIVSFEALARWNDTQRGMVPPSIFVPIIEELGLVVEFGAWVLERACQECATWPGDIRVGVNLSALQIRNDPQLEQRILKSLGAAGLSPKRLELEITETILLEASDASMAMLERLRAIGIKIALDDFGTGYSSLSYLLSVPLDKLKIDRSFVSALGKQGQAGILVGSVAKLGAELGMIVTAEGIETEAQREFLHALHFVVEGQGYLFGKPTPAHQARDLIEAGLTRHAS